jgi:hypothetical protein
MEIMTKKDIWAIIYDLNQEDIFCKLVETHIESGTTTAFLNLENGVVEYVFVSENESLEHESHLVKLEVLSGKMGVGLFIEDFLSDVEIEKIGIDLNWGMIRNLDDYNVRLKKAMKHNYQGLNLDNIDKQINKKY